MTRSETRHGNDTDDHMDDDQDDMDDPSPPTGPAPGPEARRRRRPRAAAVVAAGLGLALFAAACSSGPPTPGVAGSGSTPTTGSSSNQASSSSNQARNSALLAYAQCMRAHGVPNFPDPNGQGQIAIQGGPGSGLDPNSPNFKSAQKACQSKIPAPTPAEQAQAMQNALKVSQCMRNHGIKDFPDPKTSGGHISMTINGSPGSDLNPNNPLFQAAQKACMPNAPKLNTHGQSTGNGGAAVFGGGS